MALTKKDPRIVSLSDDEGGLGEWYSEHATAINWVLGIVLIAVIGWRVYDWVHQSGLERANAAFGEVQQGYGTAVAEPDVEKREKSLSELAPKAETVASSHAGQPLSREAQLLAGNALFYLAETTTSPAALDQFKKAQGAYQKYIGMAQTDQERAVGQLALGNTLENMAFLTADQKAAQDTTKEALNAYKEVQQRAPNSYLAAEAQLAQARLLQNMTGRQDEARKLYEAVATERKLPAPSAKNSDTTLTTQQGREISPEQIADIRSFTNESYQKVAEKSAERLQGLPTKAQ